MKYIITDSYGDDIEIVRDESLVTVEVNGRNVTLDLEQFKDFRRAVGYVWTEIS